MPSLFRVDCIVCMLMSSRNTGLIVVVSHPRRKGTCSMTRLRSRQMCRAEIARLLGDMMVSWLQHFSIPIQFWSSRGQHTIRNRSVICLLIKPIRRERIRNPRMTWFNKRIIYRIVEALEFKSALFLVGCPHFQLSFSMFQE